MAIGSSLLTLSAGKSSGGSSKIVAEKPYKVFNTEADMLEKPYKALKTEAEILKYLKWQTAQYSGNQKLFEAFSALTKFVCEEPDITSKKIKALRKQYPILNNKFSWLLCDIEKFYTQLPPHTYLTFDEAKEACSEKLHSLASDIHIASTSFFSNELEIEVKKAKMLGLKLLLEELEKLTESDFAEPMKLQSLQATLVQLFCNSDVTAGLFSHVTLDVLVGVGNFIQSQALKAELLAPPVNHQVVMKL